MGSVPIDAATDHYWFWQETMSLSALHADIAARYSALNQSISKGTIKPEQAAVLSDRYAWPVSKDSLGMARTGAAEVSGINRNDFSIPFTISTQTEDRDGDVVRSLGGEIGAYAGNPIIFFGHQSWQIPIGVSRPDINALPDVRMEERRVRSRCWFDRPDEDAMFIFGKVERGILNAASISFLAIQAYRREQVKAHTESMTPPGWFFKRWELTEWSVVGIGANAGALRDSLDAEKSFIRPRLVKALQPFAAVAKGRCFSGYCPCPPCDKEFDEADHPRGQPDNAGQFGPGSGVPETKPSESGSEESQPTETTTESVKQESATFGLGGQEFTLYRVAKPGESNYAGTYWTFSQEEAEGYASQTHTGEDRELRELSASIYPDDIADEDILKEIGEKLGMDEESGFEQGYQWADEPSVIAKIRKLGYLAVQYEDVGPENAYEHETIRILAEPSKDKSLRFQSHLGQFIHAQKVKDMSKSINAAVLISGLPGAKKSACKSYCKCKKCKAKKSTDMPLEAETDSGKEAAGNHEEEHASELEQAIEAKMPKLREAGYSEPQCMCLAAHFAGKGMEGDSIDGHEEVARVLGYKKEDEGGEGGEESMSLKGFVASVNKEKKAEDEPEETEANNESETETAREDESEEEDKPEYKQSAKWLGAMHNHMSKALDFTNHEIPITDHPQMAKAMTAHVKDLEGHMENYKDMANKFHSDIDFEKMCKDLGGGGEAEEESNETGTGEEAEASSEEGDERHGTKKDPKELVQEYQNPKGGKRGVKKSMGPELQNCVKEAADYMTEGARDPVIPTTHKSAMKYHAAALYKCHKDMSAPETPVSSEGPGLENEQPETMKELKEVKDMLGEFIFARTGQRDISQVRV